MISHMKLAVRTKGKGLYPFTADVSKWLHAQEVQRGLLVIFIQHTSCSLVIQENADPDVRLDLRDFFERLVPEDERGFRHTAEGADDMTSHVRAALTQTSLTIPVIGKRMALGTWQGLYVFEHRAAEHERQLVLQLMGD